MRLLVTGGAGFIGSALVRRAIAAGHQVVNLDVLTYAANLANVASVARDPGYAFEQVDIRDRGAVSDVFAKHRPDAVVHLAAESHVDRSIDDPGAFIGTNITGTYNLLEAALDYWIAEGRAEEFRFHHISTDEVFGSLGATGRFNEQTPYAPNSPYSASKAASDHLVRAWSRTYGLPTLLTNCSNNYGPFQHPEKLVPVAIIRMLANEPVPVYGDGRNVRDWLFVEDHADALLSVLEHGQIGQTYNIGGNSEVSNIELVRMIGAIMDAKIPVTNPRERLIEFVEDRPGHDYRYAIDPGKIARELGWRPKTGLADGLEKTINWYVANRDWWQTSPRTGAWRQRLGRAR